MTVKPAPVDPTALSRLRQQLHQLGQQYAQLLDRLVGVDEMILGSCFEVYKTCSKPNCCCHHGQKHGPFLALTFSIAGKVRHRMVRHADQQMVKRGARIYKDFQTTRRQLRRVGRSIDELLDRLRSAQAREYV